MRMCSLWLNTRVCFTCLIIRLMTYQDFYWEPIFEHALFQTSADNWDRRCAANFLRTALAPTTTLLKIQFGGEDQRRLRKCLCKVATLLPRRPYPRLYLPRLLPLSSFPFLCAGDLFGVDLCFNCFIEGFAHNYWLNWIWICILLRRIEPFDGETPAPTVSRGSVNFANQKIKVKDYLRVRFTAAWISSICVDLFIVLQSQEDEGMGRTACSMDWGEVLPSFLTSNLIGICYISSATSPSL